MDADNKNKINYKVFIFVTIVIILYVILGGLLFRWLEKKSDVSNPPSPTAQTVQSLGKDRRLGKDELEAFLKNLLDQLLIKGWWLNLTVIHNGGENETNESDAMLNVAVSLPPTKEKWDLFGSIFYAETIVTTIGYGQISPSTEAGRLTSCLYAIIGIPLIGLWATNIGEIILKTAKKLRKRIEIKKKRHLEFLIVQFCVITLIGSFLFILCPALLFAYMENWPYSDGIYFSVITLSTIGLGDLVAASKEGDPGWYRALLNLWLFFGLAWLSMLISLGIGIYRTRASQVLKQAEEKVIQLTNELWEKFMRQKRITRRNSFSGKRQVSVMLSKTSPVIQVLDLKTGVTRLISHRDDDVDILIQPRENDTEDESSGDELLKSQRHQISVTRRQPSVIIVSNELVVTPGSSRRTSLASLLGGDSAHHQLLTTIRESEGSFTEPSPKKTPHNKPRPKRFTSYAIGSKLVVETNKKKPSLGLRSASVLLFDRNQTVDSDEMAVNISVLEQLAQETSPITNIGGEQFLSIVTPERDSCDEMKGVVTTIDETSILQPPSSPTLILTPPQSSSRRPSSQVSIRPHQLSTQQSSRSNKVKRGISILNEAGTVVHTLENDAANMVVMTEHGICECLGQEITLLRPRSKSLDGE